jgi:8-amino-7-oxononanoate synthase
MAFSFIDEKLAQAHQQGRYRERQLIENSQGREIRVAGKSYLNFSSNDYLGLNQETDIVSALEKGAQLFGSSSSASSLVTGYHQVHQDLEQALCAWLNLEACLLFTSGFSANSGVLASLANKDTQIVLDKLSHASLIDGAVLAKAQANAKFTRFHHNDTDHLASRLAKHHGDQLIVTESIFSMDGDLAPLAEIQSLQQRHQAMLYIDDAHGLGVLGDRGQGATSQVATDDILLMGTFGKALASSGAFIGGSRKVIDYLINYCRHYIFSTSISPAQAYATLASISLCQQQQWRRDKIFELQQLFKKGLKDTINITNSSSSIIGVIVGEEVDTLAVSKKLKERGIWLSAIRPPTVPVGTSRLRVTVTANHNAKDIKYLTENLNELIN